MPYHMRVRAGAVIIEQDRILLTEYNDPNRGIVYDLPAGGVEPGESIIDAVKREAKEEACIEVEVGPLAFVYEYAPHLTGEKYGPVHTLVLMFECTRLSGLAARLPEQPDPNQTGVKWIALSQLEEIQLYADIGKQIQDYALHKRNIDLIEEHRL
ncbi:NUDIX domain-containing protein [Bacillus infantis]|uniref:NUDIX domain-containing protein n=1 Tax=Bacillus infantis TaxID=324767 RepID=UPI001CD4543F|nr:NUDIX domain-containing protein [Bacillus infantis]MCA1041233.1 NUDIX domain-containing protein [Bacillus infantis]